ncbi:MAG: Rossmann-like and DUF2520 domain-containing protein [Acidimicrobiia bacterium]
MDAKPSGVPVRSLALVGPGRAGTGVALALARAGWRVRAVAGGHRASPTLRSAAELLDASTVAVEDAGRDVALVIVATPDALITSTAARVAPSLAPGALVVHLSGSRSVSDLDPIRTTRPDVEVGVLHPLQSLPSPEVGAQRLAGAWCAVSGPESVTDLAADLGMHPFVVADGARTAYHAAATIASNHLVALLGQAQRVAASAGVPFDALLPLVQATVDNLAELGPAGALTGPVARGDVSTVAGHLDALPESERPAYRALADAALRLAGRDDPALRSLVAEPRP